MTDLELFLLLILTVFMPSAFYWKARAERKIMFKTNTGVVVVDLARKYPVMETVDSDFYGVDI